MRNLASKGKQISKYPPSMPDKYKISSAHPVPDYIPRPSYVGQEPQNFPPLTGKIHVMNAAQIASLKVAANLAARTLKVAIDSVRPGMSLDDIDKIVHDHIVADGAYPSAIDFMHFPKSVCLSVNDVVSHGVPNSYVLKPGDYLNIDVVCFKEGHHGDNSAMVMVETDEIKVPDEIKRLS